MACRKMNEDVAYARNTESGCKHSAQLVTLSAQRLAYGSMSLEPTETRPRSNFQSQQMLFPRYDQLS